MSEPSIRTFESGATRGSEEMKADYEGFLSPAVLRRYAQYMGRHRKQPDGSVRASDNWQKGIPQEVYLKSLIRHEMDVWLLHREEKVTDPETGENVTMEDALCGVMFNAMGMLFEILKQKSAQKPMGDVSGKTESKVSNNWVDEYLQYQRILDEWRIRNEEKQKKQDQEKHEAWFLRR